VITAKLADYGWTLAPNGSGFTVSRDITKPATAIVAVGPWRVLDGSLYINVRTQLVLDPGAGISMLGPDMRAVLLGFTMSLTPRPKLSETDNTYFGANTWQSSITSQPPVTTLSLPASPSS
jgi:hypothetical protein